MMSKLAASISPLSAAICKRFRNSNSSSSMVALFGRHHRQIICRSLIPLEKDWLGGPILQIAGQSLRPLSRHPSELLQLLVPSLVIIIMLLYLVMTLVNGICTLHIHQEHMLYNWSLTLYEIVEAISEFGKVTDALFVNASNGLKCCHIKFESVDSSRQAVLAGKISVGSQEYPVHPFDAVDVLAVRIRNINQNTSDCDIHRICKSLGELVGLARMSKDSSRRIL